MRVISRRTDAGIEVFDADLEPVRVFPAPAEGCWTVSSTRDALVHATDDAVVRIDPDGGERWRFGLDGTGMVDVRFSADDSAVWVYAPAEQGEDEWIVLDAATGVVHSRRSLPTVGQGGTQFPLRDGRMLLHVGEGQDSSRIFLADPVGNPHEYPGDDRVLIDVSPDQLRFMTVDHAGQEDVVLHDLPSGEPRFRLNVADFGEDPEVGVIEWAGGFLDDDTMIAVVYGEDEQAWWRHYRVDTGTGEVLGDLGIVTIYEDDLQPLGDGTYVITDTDGTLRRM